MSLTRNSLVTVTVDNVSLGIWTSKSGGQTEADGVKTRLGGMSDEVALGGPASTENVVVARVYDTFMQTKVKWLRSLVGTGSMSVSVTPLGNNKQPSGPTDTFTGTVNRVTPPESDDNSNDVAMIELELLTNQSVA
jgi:hypothetical protein